jgi:hypothetical protein
LRLYLDTSLVVSALVHEPSSPAVLDWLAERRTAQLLISDWVVSEFSAALSVKLRSRQITDEVKETALAAFHALLASSFDRLAVSREQFRLAAAFADRSLVGLRAGDALHLAIAAANAITVCTRDRRLAEAGAGLGVKTEFVSSLS